MTTTQQVLPFEADTKRDVYAEINGEIKSIGTVETASHTHQGVIIHTGVIYEPDCPLRGDINSAMLKFYESRGWERKSPDGGETFKLEWWEFESFADAYNNNSYLLNLQ